MFSAVFCASSFLRFMIASPISICLLARTHQNTQSSRIVVCNAYELYLARRWQLSPRRRRFDSKPHRCIRITRGDLYSVCNFSQYQRRTEGSEIKNSGRRIYE
ncbi:hypothetical protein B0J14DRAFT_606362 [Halenospora varia]|nr:hypothetical protein B0J14DRAFT_606362 [Halenospora varia]